MDDILRKNRTPAQVDSLSNGLIFGVIAGFWLSVGVWGLDAVLLYLANGDLPWLKLLIGAPLLIIISAAAGWLTARFDNSALGAFWWMLAGLCMVWIASHLPFEGLSFVIGLLEPSLSGLEIYPFVESARIRMSLLYVVVGVLAAIGGGLELLFVEAATNSSAQYERILRLSFSLVIFIPIGLVVDNLINSSLRLPIQGTDQLIQFGLQVRSGGVSKETQREMGIRALTPFGEKIQAPYRIILGYYDPETLEETRVYPNFSGDWGVCSLIRGRPFVCWLSAERYLKKLACLVETGSPSTCRLKLYPGAEVPPPQLFSQLDAAPLKYGILSQRGSVVLAVAEDSQGDQVECVLRESGDVFLQRCTQVSGQQYDALALPPTWTPPAPPALTPTQVSLPAEPAEPGPISPGEILLESEDLDPSLFTGAPAYAISLEISHDLRSFQGHAQIDFTNQEKVPLEEIFLRLLPNGNGSYGNGSLRAENIRVEGNRVNSDLSVEDTVLKIDLPTPLQPGQKTKLELDFQGSVPQDFGGSATPSGYGIYNFTDGVLALSGWYPILAVYDEQGWNLDPPSYIGDSVYSDIGFYSVKVTLPNDLIIAATGLETDHIDQGDTSLFSFVSGPTRDFFIIIGSDYHRISEQVGGTVLNIYYKSGDELAGNKALSVAAASLTIFNEKFGKYPFSELDVVAAPMRNALGVEFPGIVLIGQDLYAQPGKPEFEITIAHEVAHQWWYGVVGNDVFDEPWLDESLATYSSSLYYEFGFGLGNTSGLFDYWQQRYDRLVNEGRDDLIAADLAYFEDLNQPSIYGGVVYIKGALFLSALRAEIGDPAFFQALQDYYRTKAFEIARAEDLLSSFENAAGRELDEFYQQWLYTKR